MCFDVLDKIELINQPLLMLVGDKADTAYMSEAAYKEAASKDKRLHKLKHNTYPNLLQKRSGGGGIRRAVLWGEFVGLKLENIKCILY
ncbi:hypothetical protein [Helicobacter typhlonius]